MKKVKTPRKRSRQNAKNCAFRGFEGGRLLFAQSHKILENNLLKLTACGSLYIAFLSPEVRARGRSLRLCSPARLPSSRSSAEAPVFRCAKNRKRSFRAAKRQGASANRESAQSRLGQLTRFGFCVLENNRNLRANLRAVGGLKLWFEKAFLSSQVRARGEACGFVPLPDFLQAAAQPKRPFFAARKTESGAFVPRSGRALRLTGGLRKASPAHGNRHDADIVAGAVLRGTRGFCNALGKLGGVGGL